MSKIKTIQPVLLEEEIQKSYIDYAMSVIVGRALPDVRDGLKPVHRRLIYSMFESGVLSHKPYKKSARIVGDCMGKYHPHGDAALYDTLVRMAQDFSMRYPLIDGQGNFGSLDGDSPAAMRYTEVRLTPLAEELLKEDIDKETVDWTLNYDGTLKEPLILPSRFPNLLANGSSGIAVGMSTNIPPHNLRELVDVCIYILRNPNYTIEKIIEIMPGPDFPTGGIINGKEGIREAYETGKGTIKIQSKALIETQKGKDKENLVITEIPYQINKANLVSSIAELIQNEKLEGVSDIRDESSREGIRIVLELKKGVNAQVILNYLYKHTSLQTSFGIQLLTLVGKQPQILPLGKLIELFLNFRKEIIYRRCTFDLKKAEERAHILEGFKIALDNLDKVISLIRSSKTVEEARKNLQEKFSLTEIQANAILDLKLQKLTGLEREKILEEYKNVLKLIEDLKDILSSEERIKDIIEKELKEIKEKYGDDRRTIIQEKMEEINLEDTIAEEDMVITISHKGYIKRTALTTYRIQHRGGKGRIGMSTGQEDFLSQAYVASTHDFILFFTNFGKVYWLKAYEIPEVGSAGRGNHIVNLLNLQEGEKVVRILDIRNFEDDLSLIFATKLGKVKRTALQNYSNIRKTGIQAIKIEEGDDLVEVRLLKKGSKIFIATEAGYSICFEEKDVREMQRVAIGVTGIKLRKDDKVVGMEVIEENKDILTVCTKGYGKRTALEEYRIQKRGGFGIINVKVTEKNGPVLGILEVSEEDEIIIVTEFGKIIRLKVSQISKYHRSSQGVRLVDLEAEDKITDVIKLPKEEEEE
jgi:DNA gyrase subunit A